MRYERVRDGKGGGGCVEYMYIYAYVHDLWLPSVLTVSFLFDGGGEGVREGESDPGRARWFAYSPLHNLTRWRLYIMYPRRVAAMQVQRCTHTVHPSVSCRHARCCTCVEEGGGRRVEESRIIYPRPILVVSLLRPPSFSASSIENSCERDSRFDDSSGEFASLESATWTQRQPLAIAYCKLFSLRLSLLSFIHLVFLPRRNSTWLSILTQIDITYQDAPVEIYDNQEGRQNDRFTSFDRKFLLINRSTHTCSLLNVITLEESLCSRLD